jgi:hypothetical protein
MFLRNVGSLSTELYPKNIETLQEDTVVPLVCLLFRLYSFKLILLNT